MTDPEENLMDGIPEFPYDKKAATALDVADEVKELTGVMCATLAGVIFGYGEKATPQVFHDALINLETPSGRVVAEHRSRLALAVDSFVGNFVAELMTLSVGAWKQSLASVLHEAVLEEVQRLRDEGEL
jgi:hypothetical protein